MRKKSNTCVNFGKCGRAGLPASEGECSCPECGHALVAASAPGFRLFPIIASFVVLGVIVAFLSLAARHHLNRAADHSVSEGIIAGGNNTSPGAEYFTGGEISALMRLAENGDLEAVRRLLASRPDLPRVRGKGGITPLHAALFSNEPTSFTTLLIAGFDPDVPADNGITPLMAATFHQSSSYLEAALKKSKAPNRKDLRGRDALFLAVANRRTSNVRMLLAHGSNPNARDARGNTLLMAAFQGRRPDKEIVRLLLSAVADSKLTDTVGLGARDFAATFHDPELLALLP